jgi:prohibitin 2
MAQYQNPNAAKKTKAKKIVLFSMLGVFLIIVLALTIVVVDTGHTGIIVTGGAVSDATYAPGFHLKAPFVQNVVQIDNRTQKIEGQGSAVSKDLQMVTTDVAVNFKVPADYSTSIYKNVGVGYPDTLIQPAIQESIKAVTAQFTVEQLITERQAVGAKIKDLLAAKVSPYGIQIEIFNIMNFAFSQEFMAAVEAKQTAQQQALKAQQDLARIKIEAQQTVTQAQAQADSIRLIQDMLTTAPNYIEYMKWQKWDGKWPSVVAGSDAGFMFNVGNVTTTNP